jgi:hypothetical protein
MANPRRGGRSQRGRQKKKDEVPAVEKQNTSTAIETKPTAPLERPQLPSSTNADQLSIGQAVRQWIVSKFKKTQKADKRPASQKLKLWREGTAHGAALATSFVAGLFCMYAMVAPGVDLQVKLAAAALLAYIVKKFVNFLTL